MELTRKEREALKFHWQMPLRVKNGNVELKNGDCWGILCSVEDGKVNAQMIIDKQNQTKESFTRH